MSSRRHFGLTATRANSKFDEREVRAWVVVSLCAVTPLAFVVLCLSGYRLFQWLVAS